MIATDAVRPDPSPAGSSPSSASPAADWPEPTPPVVPGSEARLLRRLRRVVRRRVRVDLTGPGPHAGSDGDLAVRLETVSARDPRVLDWRADRVVALVVLHDGCGARVLGHGGLGGRIELPPALCPSAFLAFCYDADPERARPGRSDHQPALRSPETALG